MVVEQGTPLRINELNIVGLVDELAKRGIKTTSSKVFPLHPAQVQVIDDEARFKVVACGRRFGKTLLCVFTALAVALQPGRKIWIVSDNYELTDRVFLELYHLIVNELKLASSPKGGASRLKRYIKLNNGSTIHGKTCENRSSLVGEALDLIIWDEASLTTQGKDIWDQELRPCLTDRKGSAIFISTPRGKNHFYKWFLDGKSGMTLRQQSSHPFELLNEEDKIKTQWSSFQFSSYSNTTEHGGYLDRTEFDAARLSTPPLKFRQEYLADFSAVADRAFPEFNQEIQVVDWDYNKDLKEAFSSLDFNYSTPCTTLYAQIDPSQNILIFDEFHPEEAHTTVHTQAKQLLEVDDRIGQNIIVVVADIAGKQKDLNGRSAWDDLEQWGIYPVGRKQKIETGCDLIRLWSAYPITDAKGTVVFEEDNITPKTKPKLFIHRRCVKLINALETARAPEFQSGVLKEGYRKDGVTDGPLDALRYLLVYLLHDRGGISILPAATN